MRTSVMTKPITLMCKVIFTVVCATLTVGCSGDFPGVHTCRGIRALKHGMSVEEVISQLGPPRYRAFAPECGRSFQNTEVAECWTYGSENLFNGNFTVEVSFDRQGLETARGHHDYFWSGDATDLFHLDQSGIIEKPLFEKHFKCQ